MVDAVKDARRQLRDLQRPGGTRLASLVAQVQQTLANINALVVSTVNSFLSTGTVNMANINASGNIVAGGNISAVNANLSGTVFSNYALNNPVASGYFALYVNGDGRFGRSPSARKYKQDIENFSPSEQAVFAMQLRNFRIKAAVEEFGNDAHVEVGLIAEELVEIGLGWLVLFGPDGEPESIAYEKIALALIPVIQDHEQRLLALEGRV